MSLMQSIISRNDQKVSFFLDDDYDVYELFQRIIVSGVGGVGKGADQSQYTSYIFVGNATIFKSGHFWKFCKGLNKAKW